jgi:hypothetical protein
LVHDNTQPSECDGLHQHCRAQPSHRGEAATNLFRGEVRGVDGSVAIELIDSRQNLCKASLRRVLDSGFRFEQYANRRFILRITAADCAPLQMVGHAFSISWR